MFSKICKSLFTKVKSNESELQIVNLTYKEQIETKLTELNEITVNSHNDDSQFTTQHDVINDFEILSITGTNDDNDIDTDSVNIFDDSKSSEISSIGENTLSLHDVDFNAKKFSNQISNLQCLFTWKLRPNNRKNIILMIQKKYGEYNLNISLPEFTLERFISNLIIAYELFHNGETELGQMKVLEIGNWLEELDSLKDDEFYLSINVGLKHIMTGTFIHMLFATNLTEECTWLLESIVSFNNMDSKSRAAIYAIRASILNEYGGNADYLKKVTDYAKKACDLDPNTSYWFYIYSLSLTAHRQYLHTIKSSPTKDEINSIQQAIALSDGKNTRFNYHRMILDRDTVIRYFHDNRNKKDKSVHQKNVKDNKTLVHMIKTIASMEPKDPLLLVNCAKTIMTLPAMVRDFNSGKNYLSKALKMAPNDKAVFEAVEKTIELYKKISIKSNTTFDKKPLQSQLRSKTPKLGEEMGILVKKHQKGESVISDLTKLTAKYNGMDQCKLMAQFCSYNVLFANNLKNAVEQFIWLIDQPGMVNNYIITQHFSSFGSKKFNLAELICNELRLATNASTTTSEDMLFYYKILTNIMETCNLKMKDVDSSMKTKLIVNNLSDKISTYTHKTQKSETDSLDHESVDKNENCIRSRRPTTKPCTTTDSKVCYKKSDWNKRSNKKNVSSTHWNTRKNVQNKKLHTISNDEMKFKMEKFFNTAEARPGISNNSNPVSPLLPDNIRNIKTQAEIDRYTHQLYENILIRGQQQNNPSHVHYLNSLLNQTPLLSQETLRSQQTKKNP